MKKKAARLVLMAFLMCCHQVQAEDSISLLIDRQEIAQLVSEYAQRWDNKDAAGVAALFSEDASIGWVLGQVREPRTVSGRSNIQAYAQTAYEQRLDGKQSRHHFTNLLFKEINSESALTEHTVYVTHVVDGEKPVSVASGYYRIHWTKRGGSWFILDRILFLDR